VGAGFLVPQSPQNKIVTIRARAPFDSPSLTLVAQGRLSLAERARVLRDDASGALAKSRAAPPATMPTVPPL
jgi:hypothetical protein